MLLYGLEGSCRYTEVAELTHRLWTHTRRLIHKFSLATGISNPWTFIDFHRAPGYLIYKDRDSPLDSSIDVFRFTLATSDLLHDRSLSSEA